MSKKNIYAVMGLITFTVVLVALAFNLTAVGDFFQRLLKILTPFLVGAAMAFILDVPMSFFEKKLPIKKKKLEKLRRPLAYILTILILSILIFVILFLVIPELFNTLDTISAIGNKIPEAAQQIEKWAYNFSDNNPEIMKFFSDVSIDWKSYAEKIVNTFKDGLEGVLTSTVGILTGTISAIVTFFIGFIFSIYILFQKEKLGGQGKQILYAFLPEKKVEKVLYILRMAVQAFRKILTGQCTEAVILGSMFFVVLSIFRIEYALLISVMIAVTALIPVFGAFIGCGVGLFLLIFSNPMQALWFFIIFIILQQLEGNLIYPHVVGGSVGLPSIWVLVAVTVGGSLMGVVGMLVCIPLSSVLYTLFREYVKKRLQERNVVADKYRQGLGSEQK